MEITKKGAGETTICLFRKQLGDLAKGLFEEINKQTENKGFVVKEGKGKNKKHCYGLKAHIGVDKDSGIIRKAEITQARVSENEIFHELISGKEKAIYTDKACYDKQRAREIEAKGIKNGLMMKKAHGGAPISKEDRKRNKEISKIRTRVKRPFAIIMSKWGHARARYI